MMPFPHVVKIKRCSRNGFLWLGKTTMAELANSVWWNDLTPENIGITDNCHH